MISKWYLFIISIIIAFILARTYINHTLPVYKATSIVQINENANNTSLNDQILQGMGLPSGARNIQNQIIVVKSGPLPKEH
jgi:uncharacterized protein involved in exopolysaccharide biosynthesis